MAPPVGEKETRYLKSVINERPDSLLFARLADVYRKEGNIEQAIELCLNGLNVYPYYVTGRILLGRCYLEQQKTAEAVQEFTAVCSTDRRNQVAIKMLADIFARQGMEDKAGDLYALLLAMDPGHPTLSQLCSRYQSSGTTDLFTILGIGTEMSGAPSVVEPPLPEDLPDATLVEQSSLPDDFSFEGVADAEGDDGEFNAAAQSPAEAAIDTMEPVPSEDISGGDISDRMSMLFGEEGEVPSESAAQPLQEDFTESAIEGLLNPDEDLSGTDVSDRIEELFTDGAEESPSVTDTAGDHIDDAATVVDMQLPGGFDGLTLDEADADVSGTDVSDRLGELFGEELDGVGAQAEAVNESPQQGTEETGEDAMDLNTLEAVDDGNLTTMDQALLPGNDENGISQETLVGGQEEEVLSLDSFGVDGTADTDDAVPNLPELDLSEPEVLSLDGGEEFLSGSAEEAESQNEASVALPELSLDEGFTPSTLELDTVDSANEAVSITPVEPAESEDSVTGDDIADRIGSVFEEMALDADKSDKQEVDLSPTIASEETGVATEQEITAGDALDSVVTGEDIADRLDSVFDENGSTNSTLSGPFGKVDEEASANVPEMEITTESLDGAPNDEAYLEETMVTSTDFAEHLSSEFKGQSPISPITDEDTENPEVKDAESTSVPREESTDRLEMVFEEPMEEPSGSGEGLDSEMLKVQGTEPPSDDSESVMDVPERSDEAVTGDDITDRLDMVFEEPEEEPSGISDGLDTDAQMLQGNELLSGDSEAVVDISDQTDSVVTGDDITDRLDMVFEESPQESSGNGDGSGTDAVALQGEAMLVGDSDATEELPEPAEAMVTGSDIADRLGQVFDEPSCNTDGMDSVLPSFQDDEPLEQTYMEPQPESTPAEGASNNEPEITGSDMEERIATLFEDQSADAAEESFGQQPDTAVPEEISAGFDMQSSVTGDDISGRIDEVFSEADVPVGESLPERSEPESSPHMDNMSASFAEAADSLFAPNVETKRGSEEESQEDDFMAPDFEETMQFDSALFEEMLNPTDPNAPFVEEKSEAPQISAEKKDALVSDDTSLSTDGRTESIPIVPTGMEQDDGTMEEMMSRNDSLVLDSGNESTTEDRIIKDNRDSDGEFNFEVSTEQFVNNGGVDLIEDAPAAEERLDRTAVFEVNVSETQTDLVLEPDNSEPVETAWTPEESVTATTPVSPSVDEPDTYEVYHENTGLLAEAEESTEKAATPHSESMGGTGETSDDDATFAGVELVDSGETDAFSDNSIASSSPEPEELSSEVSGADVEERLSAMFPGDDLLSLSSKELLPPEDDQEEVMDRVADFYTISGDDAEREGAGGSVPETIADVEFNVPLPGSKDDVAAAEEQPETAQQAGSENEEPHALAEDGLFVDVSSHEHTFAEETVVIDQRDKPFDIPDHVMTPTLADIYYQQGQHQLALEIYSRLADREPDNEKLTARMEKIRQMMAEADEQPALKETPDAARSTSTTRMSGAAASRKKKKTAGKVDDPRPLAGVRIKKKAKKARKSTRKRS